MTTEPYFQPPNSGPRCSTPRSARLRQLRFEMGYEKRATPPEYAALSQKAKEIYLENEPADPALAKARALRYVVENCPAEINSDTVFLGGESPFLFWVLRDTLYADGCARADWTARYEAAARLHAARVFMGPCFVGHITPGFEFVLGQGISGLRGRVEEELGDLRRSEQSDPRRQGWYEAARMSCETALLYARRYGDEARRLASVEPDPARAAQLRFAADVLEVVPAQPARTLYEALQSYWMVYILATIEMGGLDGGGCGLGRLDQFLYPYYVRDLQSGRLTRAQALELLELFLLCFRHEDYYTDHQVYTPGSQGSLGGVTPSGADASNELTELIMEASLRLAMPAPYISVRLHRCAPERYWQAAANYVLGGLGFSVVNDEALIPAFIRHGRSLADARDYICACCYEHTIPGREIYHPSCVFVSLPALLELGENGDRRHLPGTENAVCPHFPEDMDAVWEAFRRRVHYVLDQIVAATNFVDAAHSQHRRYPLMSLFFEDCIARGMDVCEGGARYNLTGCVVAGVPDVVNSLAAIEHCVFQTRQMSMSELVEALRVDFVGHEALRRRLLAAPKWGNGDARVDRWAAMVADMLYDYMAPRRNARGGRWQLALYSFVANAPFGQALGASADGRRARGPLTRNMNPARGTDLNGPTAVLRSLSAVDWTKFPNGASLDLRFDPSLFAAPEERKRFAAFLKGFVDLGVMQLQITMADTGSLLDARAHPENWPNLMVKVAGYSARFVDLPDAEKNEIINRSLQRLG